MRTSESGERFIELTDLTTIATGSVKPVGASNKSLAERLMDGLYVRTWGRVREVSPAQHWYVLTDGSDPVGIKVVTPGEPTVSIGDYTTATGAAGWDGRRVP
ncbi:MAG: hypothetical protein ACUVRS_09725 [Armatimonadota bacterium]